MRRQGNILPRLAALACFCLPLAAAASGNAIHAGFDCQPERDRLILTYDTAYGYAWEKMAEKASATQWDPRMLVTYNDDGFIGDVRSEHGVCRLSDGEYRIEIVPNPGNANVQGVCGAWMGAGAKVEKDGKTLFDGNFDNSCHLPDEPVISRVLIRPGKAALTRMTSPDKAEPGLTFVASCQPEQRRLLLRFGFDAGDGQRIENLFEDDGAVTQVMGDCALDEGEYYYYVLRPFVPGGKACGAAKWVSAHLYITKNGQIIYDAPFMGDCRDPDVLVVREIAVRPGREPEAETLPAALFYDPDGVPDDGVYHPAESRE